MALFSFWKRNSTASASHDSIPPAASARARTRTDAQRKDRDSAIDAELPQKRSARRRLIGAVVLVLAASLFLPMIFDSEPKASFSEARIIVPDEAPAKTPAKTPARTPASPAGGAEQKGNGPRGIPPQHSLDRGEELVTDKDGIRALAKGEKPVESSSDRFQKKIADKTAEKPADKTADKPAEKTSEKGRVIVQIGAFPAESNAQNWQAKLKAVKVPTFVEKQAWQDGERFMLRAGPFSTREQAEAAIAEIQRAGLSGRIAP